MANSVLPTLIELTEKASEQAAKELGAANKNKEAANAQLILLIQYRSDYESRLETQAQLGLSMARYNNFQKFIDKLDVAIEGQKKIIADAEYKVKLATDFWQSCEKKRLSYQTLTARNELKVQTKQNKLEQKQTDEQASRIHFYKSK